MHTPLALLGLRASLFAGIALAVALGLSGCNGTPDRATLESAKVRELDESAASAAESHAGHDHTGHDHSQHAAPQPEGPGQKVEVETHDHKMDPRLAEKPTSATTATAKPDACCEKHGKTVDGKAHECKEGSDDCAGSDSSKDAAKGAAEPEAGSGSSNCTCSKDKPSCKCGHCSGAIDTCHCSHSK